MVQKILANYTQQTSFPLDEETLQYIQNNNQITEMLGNIFGGDVILRGCELEGTTRSNGYVFIHTNDHPEGEVLPFEGGNENNDGNFYLDAELIPVTANGIAYNNAYTKRRLRQGLGTESYLWSNIATLSESSNAALKAKCASLQTQIELLSPPPLGVVQIFAGASVPDNYALCDGRELSIEDYPDLYNAIGTNYNGAANRNGEVPATSDGCFRLPDLSGRFIVGYNDTDTDYSTKGSSGGEKKHQLTISEMPSHQHVEEWPKMGSGNWKGGGSNSAPNTTANYGDLQHTQYNGTDVNTWASGGDQPHENRPPYYTLAYIIRLK